MTNFSIISDSAAYTNSTGLPAGTNTSNVTSSLVRAGYGQGQNTVGPDAANRSLLQPWSAERMMVRWSSVCLRLAQSLDHRYIMAQVNRCNVVR